jgi:hypothetical protein
VPLSLDPPLELRPHHADAVIHLRDRLADDPDVLALLLGGSLAHGFAGELADGDYVVVVTAEEHRRREATGRLTEAGVEGCTYPGGYTDGKFVDVELLRAVAERGSEPARFAFQDARFVIERDPAVRALVGEIVRYPVDGVDDRIERFTAQLLAWQWFHGEALGKQNRYLELLAMQKLTLFSCRIVLAANRLLYPYHKWMLRVTESAPRRPPGLVDDLHRLLDAPSAELVDRLVRTLVDFAGLDRAELERTWGGYFLRDNELTWVSGCTPIDDL